MTVFLIQAADYSLVTGLYHSAVESRDSRLISILQENNYTHINGERDSQCPLHIAASRGKSFLNSQCPPLIVVSSGKQVLPSCWNATLNMIQKEIHQFNIEYQHEAAAMGLPFLFPQISCLTLHPKTCLSFQFMFQHEGTTGK